MRRLLPFLFSLVMALHGTADAGDDIRGVTAVWSDFISSIRRGDYPNAHSLFSPQSQAAMPYEEFVAEYGPLSVAREMVLAKPESQATDLDEDWAEIVYGGVNPGSGRKFKVGVSFVRNEGEWGLVAARNEEQERVEAGARAMLRLLWEARGKAEPRALVEAMTQVQEESPVLLHYRLETDGTTFRAFPLQKGFRTFYVDGWGLVKSMEKTPPQKKRGNAASLAVPARSVLPDVNPSVQEKRAGDTQQAGQVDKADRDHMPELSEPPAPRSRTGRGKTREEYGNLDGELSEPPPSRRGGRTGVTQQPVVTLPETIR